MAGQVGNVDALADYWASSATVISLPPPPPKIAHVPLPQSWPPRQIYGTPRSARPWSRSSRPMSHT